MFLWTMAKEPSDYLQKIQTKLRGIEDHQKLSFVKKHQDAILHALKSHIADIPSGVEGAGTAEAKYLMWHYNILMATEDNEVEFNSWNLSPAACEFISATRPTTAQMFSNLFKRNPRYALELMKPAKLYSKEILTEMEQLSEEKPHSYLDCVGVIRYDYDASRDTFLERWLESNTQKTLRNLLKTDAASVLFPNDVLLPNKLILIKSMPARAFAIVDNLDMIELAFEEAFPAIGRRHVDSLNSLMADAFYLPREENEALGRLETLKKKLLKEHIKQCFAAATGKLSKLEEAVEVILSDPETASDTGYFVSVKEKDSSTSVVLLSNPDLKSPTDEDQPHDLWLVERLGKILAYTFLEADLRGYMNAQKTIQDMPNSQVLDILVASNTARPD